MKFMINIAILFLIFLAFSAKAESFDKSISFDGVKRYGTDFGFEQNSHFYNNKLYWLLGNGYENGSNALKTIYSIDINTGEQIESELPLPFSMLGNSTVSYHNKVFSYGGQKNNQRNHTMNSMISYNMDNGAIEFLPSAPLSRVNSCGLAYNGSLYFFGGSGFDTFNKSLLKIGKDGFFYTELKEELSSRSEIQKYNITKKTWSILPQSKSLPSNLSCASVNEQFYFVGRSTFHDPVYDVQVYSLISNTWETINLPEGLSYARLATFKNKVVIAGKQDFSVGQSWEIYIYDTKNKLWSDKITTPSKKQFISLQNTESGIAVLDKVSSSDNNSDPYKIYFYDIPSSPSDSLAKVFSSSEFFIAEENNELFTLQTNGSNNLINITLKSPRLYKEFSESESGGNLKEVTKRIYDYIDDEFDFIFYIMDEEQVFSTSSTRYHIPVQNSIKGIGQGLFDFSSAYGSDGKLDSIIVLKQKDDLIYGPSLHELMHRWGNYLKGPLDSLRQAEWMTHKRHTPYHWDYLSSGGQLGGWNDDDFEYKLFSNENYYLLNDSVEGMVGFSGVGGGTNFFPYSKLELYLMGAIGKQEVPDLFEPNHKPIETEHYPFFEINSFTSIDMKELFEVNGEREPNLYTSQKSFNALFVVVSDTELSHSQWTSYDKQVNNFIYAGEDEYFRLNNFWEATDGLMSLKTSTYSSFLSDDLISQFNNALPPTLVGPEKLIIKLDVVDFLFAHEKPFSELIDNISVKHSKPSAYTISNNLPNKIDRGYFPFTFIASNNINSSKPFVIDVYVDYDSDSDGYIDILDEFPQNPSEWSDFDKDGVGDNQDLDDDNDGLSDLLEAQYGTDPHNNDTDGDGITDSQEIELNSDPLNADEDTDGDGYTNLEEKKFGTNPILASDYPQPFPAWINILLKKGN